MEHGGPLAVHLCCLQDMHMSLHPPVQVASLPRAGNNSPLTEAHRSLTPLTASVLLWVLGK